MIWSRLLLKHLGQNAKEEKTKKSHLPSKDSKEYTDYYFVITPIDTPLPIHWFVYPDWKAGCKNSKFWAKL